MFEEPFSTTQTLISWPFFAANCFNLIAADNPAGPNQHIIITIIVLITHLNG